MICPDCMKQGREVKLRVTYTLQLETVTQRTRKCPECGGAWVTFEEIARRVITKAQRCEATRVEAPQGQGLLP